MIKVIKTKSLDVNVYAILLPKRFKHSCYTTRWLFFQIFTKRGFYSLFTEVPPPSEKNRRREGGRDVCTQVRDFRVEKYLNLIF